MCIRDRTGKRLLQWQASCEPEEYWIVDDIEGRLDPAHHRGRRLIANIADWLELHPAEKRQPWCVEIPRLAEQAMQAVIARRDAFGEAQLAHRICDYLPEQGQLFVGNSLVVRLIDALSQLPAGYPVYSNRGASGIDGLLSTAAGVQRASGKPTLAIVGDLSALYDLNALALLRQVSAPLVLIVCLLYTSDAADDLHCVDLGGHRIIKKKTHIHYAILEILHKNEEQREER